MVPTRAAKSTFWSVFVRADALKGSQEYDFGHFCTLRCPKGQLRVRFAAYLFAQVPPKGLGGRFGYGRRYALPRNVPQRAVRAEVRKKAGGEMYLGRVWEAG